MKDLNRITDSAIYFYTPRFYAFDNFSAFEVEIWDRTFPTVEHAYQWKKYSESNPEVAEQIYNAKSAYETKQISDAHKDDFDKKWHDEKVARMEEIIRAKIEQHPKIQELLIESGDKDIIENSPTDSYWGIGEDETGQNQMGKIWMKLRDELKTSN